MTRFFITLPALAVLATTTSVLAQDHPPEAVASAILNGFVARDVAAIAPHSNAQNEGFFAAVLSGEEDAAELFEGTRGEAGTGWDGMILPARYNADGEAIVPFAIETDAGPVAALGSGQTGRLISVVLSLDGPDDTTWGLEDFNFIDPDDYAVMSQTRN